MEQAAIGNQLVYVVDDDEYIGNLIVLTLQSRGYRAKQFRCGQTMLEDLGNIEPDLIILDIVMPGANGVEITQQSAPVL
jgi:DNA-binding response OmpR family regulator